VTECGIHLCHVLLLFHPTIYSIKHVGGLFHLIQLTPQVDKCLLPVKKGYPASILKVGHVFFGGNIDGLTIATLTLDLWEVCELIFHERINQS
jgi:hypothetical protein